MTVSKWWEAYPGRLEYEISALEALGVSVRRDDSELALGRVVLHCSMPWKEENIELIATFPNLYPYFRPTVHAPDLTGLTHHRTPHDGTLCLLGRSTSEWVPGLTLAHLLEFQLPKLLKSGDPTWRRTLTPDALAELEEVQAEPLSEYYDYSPESMLLLDPTGLVESCAIDLLTYERPVGLFGVVRHPAMPTVSDHFWTAFGSPTAAFKGQHIALDSFPPVRTAAEMQSWLQERGLLEPAYPTLRKNDFDSPLGFWPVLVSFPEEVSHAAPHGTGYAAIVLPFERRKPSSKSPQPRLGLPQLAKVGRIDQASLLGRAPALSILPTKRIAVFGLGAIGGFVTQQLARSGVGKFVLVDHDQLDPGTLVRHVAPFSMSGRSKVAALRDMALAENPYVDFDGYTLGVGLTQGNEIELITKILEEVDLVLDTTAELGVQYALSQLANAAQVPYVSAWATNGAVGGVVNKLLPGKVGPCWICFQHSLNDGILKKPAESTVGPYQPPGCGTPTFTGNGFDLAEVALQAVRVVVDTLQPVPLGNPVATENVWVVDLLNPNGGPLVPQWQASTLGVHSECGDHA